MRPWAWLEGLGSGHLYRSLSLCKHIARGKEEWRWLAARVRAAVWAGDAGSGRFHFHTFSFQINLAPARALSVCCCRCKPLTREWRFVQARTSGRSAEGLFSVSLAEVAWLCFASVRQLMLLLLSFQGVAWAVGSRDQAFS